MFWLARFGSIVAAILLCFALDKIMAMPMIDDFTRRLVVLAGLYITLSVSLNLINGITGQFSMGHAAFYQVGAYTAGFISVKYFANAHMPGPLWLFLMMLAGAVVAALAGLVVGLPSLRLKGDYLAIVTLGFGEIIRIVVQNQQAIGGSYGMNVQPKFPNLFGQTGTSGIWMVWLLAVVCIAVCRNLLKNVHGLPFLAVREDEVASSAMGVNVTGVKVVAFLLGSAFAGAAGALLAHYEGFISPTMFTMELSFIVLTMVVLGGTGSITGSTIAALVLFYLPEKLRDMGAVPVSFLIGGAVGAVAMVVTMKWLSMNYHGKKATRVGLYLGSVVGGILVVFLLGLTLRVIPIIGNAAPIEANKLRMVIFALTLIFLMLLRPQGVFGHHEFSWNWVKKLMGKKDVPDYGGVGLSLLEMKDATIRFGGLVAVNKVNFEIEKGDLFGLIGPNGAGKTTCFNLITGVYEPTAGKILFKGKPIGGTPPNKIAKLGICRTFQNIRLFGSLSCLENVMVGAFLRHKTGLWTALSDIPPAIKETKVLRDEAMHLLEVVDLANVANSRSRDLSYGSQRRLEIARAMATQPELLLLDEPAAGMNPQEKGDLMETVRKIRNEHGKTVLLIEHDMRFVMGLCEKIVVLDHGEEIAYGPPAEIRNDPKVIAAYLGEAV